MEDDVREIVHALKQWLVAHQEMGFDPPPVPLEKASPPGKIPIEGEPGEDTLGGIGTLEALAEYIGDCRRCRLYRGRQNLVFGEGDPKAGLVFVGEGPGRQEDLAGRPFVGEAGKLLTRIIEDGMGIRREHVYICNVVKCRPPGNRDPEGDEVEHCLPFLKQQIRIIGPRVICSLGRVAARTLVGPEFKITRDRGKWQAFMGIPLMPTYHPAYLLRNPAAKRPVWEDVKEIMKRMGLGEGKDNG